MNGDGKADIVVGADGESMGSKASQGRAYVFSGADGSLLFTLDTPNPQGLGYFGVNPAVGDVNGDGKADIVVGAPGENAGGNDHQGRAYVFSGADGSLLFTLDTPNPPANGYFGVNTVAVGDVNGDGKADIAVGAPDENAGGNAAQGRMYVFSGADHSLLWTLDTPNPQANGYFGFRGAVGDVNGDGKADIAVAAYGESVAGNAGQGRAYVFSLASGPPPTPTPTPTPRRAPPAPSSGPPAGTTRPGRGADAPPPGAFACAAGKLRRRLSLRGRGAGALLPRPARISNMAPLNKYDAFLILVTQPVTCVMPVSCRLGLQPHPPVGRRLAQRGLVRRRRHRTAGRLRLRRRQATPPPTATRQAAGSATSRAGPTSPTWGR